jgi:hypothetical protein
LLRSARPLAALLLVVGGGCNSGPTVVLPALEVVIGSGDGQFGVVGTQLQSPLRAVVRSAQTGQPRRGVTVLWDVMSGGAVLVGATSVATDSAGAAEVGLQLGGSPGETAVRARLADQQDVFAEFRLYGVDQPTLSDVSPTSAAAGDTITLTGTNFSPVALQDVVLFSGVRGQVVAASSTSLRVVVPRCLPARAVGVHVQLGIVASADTVALTVTGGGVSTDLAVGQVLDIADDEGLECHLVPGGPGVVYVTMVYSASTVGAARHPFRLTALSSLGGVIPVVARSPLPPHDDLIGDEPADADPQAAWDRKIRAREGAAIRARGVQATAPSAASRAPAAVPAVGEVRSFHVLNPEGEFDRVGAVARAVGSRGAIFVDTLAPAGGFTNADLDSLVMRFDQVIHPRVTATFGSSSDLDANGRVIILLTPAVNRLTPPGSSGFIGGFFYGIDLLPSSTGSNAAEVFYSIVPDPTGIHGNQRSKSSVSGVVPAILAHEFQHMVHFNERILVRSASSQEALWLAEALAQMAEEMVYRDYVALGDTASQTMFRSGTRSRSRSYLQRTDTVSLIVSTGQGSLPERGAGFLQMLYVEDQLGGDVLERLTQTTLTGVANVESVVMTDWPVLLGNWWAATYLDGPGHETGLLTYPDVDLKGFLAPFPLSPTQIGAAGLSASGSLWSSSVAYYHVSPGAGVSLAMRLGGNGGAASIPHAAMRMRIVRVS